MCVCLCVCVCVCVRTYVCVCVCVCVCVHIYIHINIHINLPDMGSFDPSCPPPSPPAASKVSAYGTKRTGITRGEISDVPTND